MKTRKATEQDLESLNELQIDLAKYEAKLRKTLVDPEKVRKWYEKHYKKLIKRENSVFFVAEENGKIVGYILGEIEIPTHHHIYKRRGYIRDAFVLEEFRRKNAGKKLTQELLEWFKSKGIKWIRVDAYTNNKVGISFWKKMGFKDYVIEMTKVIK